MNQDTKHLAQKIRKAVRHARHTSSRVSGLTIQFTHTPSVDHPGTETLTMRASWDPELWDIDISSLEKLRLHAVDIVTDDAPLRADPKIHYMVLAELDRLPPGIDIEIDLI